MDNVSKWYAVLNDDKFTAAFNISISVTADFLLFISLWQLQLHTMNGQQIGFD